MRKPQGNAGRWLGQHGLEMAVFVVASIVGIYGLGQGLNRLVESGRGISLAWLALTAVAIFVLFAQMGRVHDSWPRRPRDDSRQATAEGAPLGRPSAEK